ncbi:hypothetical protein ES705_16899 [subsurface metagenome]
MLDKLITGLEKTPPHHIVDLAGTVTDHYVLRSVHPIDPGDLYTHNGSLISIAVGYFSVFIDRCHHLLRGCMRVLIRHQTMQLLIFPGQFNVGGNIHL